MAFRSKIILCCTGLALCLLCGCSAISSEASNYTWGWYILNPLQDKGASNLRFLVSGLTDTVLVSLCAMVLSVCVGLLVAMVGLSSRPWLKRMSRVYVEVFRAIPLLVLLLWVFYGLPWVLQMRLVVIPQAVKVILPALGNQFVYVLKMSSIISVIGLSELTRKANELNVSEYRPLEIYTLLVAEYLALILLVSYGVRQLERKLLTPR